MGKLEIKKPNRVSHTNVQTIHGTIDQIMPLYLSGKRVRLVRKTGIQNWCLVTQVWSKKTVYLLPTTTNWK